MFNSSVRNFGKLDQNEKLVRIPTFPKNKEASKPSCKLNSKTLPTFTSLTFLGLTLLAIFAHFHNHFHNHFHDRYPWSRVIFTIPVHHLGPFSCETVLFVKSCVIQLEYMNEINGRQFSEHIFGLTNKNWIACSQKY